MAHGIAIRDHRPIVSVDQVRDLFEANPSLMFLIWYFAAHNYDQVTNCESYAQKSFRFVLKFAK